jgi:ppGpp synthetase/RelA/SpoT-type nucleotidyltranferase
MTLNRDCLRSEYEDKKKLYEQLIGTVQFYIMTEIQSRNIKIHSFPYRIKSFDSLIDKIQRKKVKDPFQEIRDIVGLRIICLFHTDVKEVGDIVKKNFHIIEEDNKINNKDVNIFGYMSLHYKAKLKNTRKDPYYKSIKDIPFEIQIRTIAQDAWASISHYLDYKKGSEIPTQFKRDFYALSGLFYVADTHFAMLKHELTKHFIDNIGKELNNSTTRHRKGMRK